MTSGQLVGYSLNQTSAITAIVGSRIYHGNRIEGTAYPAINYFSVSESFVGGMSSEVFSINCRAATIEASKALGRLVEKMFCGSSMTGTYGVMNGFDVARVSMNSPVNTLSEPGDDCFNTVVDIRIVYELSEET